MSHPASTPPAHRTDNPSSTSQSSTTNEVDFLNFLTFPSTLPQSTLPVSASTLPSNSPLDVEDVAVSGGHASDAVIDIMAALTPGGMVLGHERGEMDCGPRMKDERRGDDHDDVPFGDDDVGAIPMFISSTVPLLSGEEVVDGNEQGDTVGDGMGDAVEQCSGGGGRSGNPEREVHIDDEHTAGLPDLMSGEGGVEEKTGESQANVSMRLEIPDSEDDASMVGSSPVKPDRAIPHGLGEQENGAARTKLSTMASEDDSVGLEDGQVSGSEGIIGNRVPGSNSAAVDDPSTKPLTPSTFEDLRSKEDTNNDAAQNISNGDNPETRPNFNGKSNEVVAAESVDHTETSMGIDLSGISQVEDSKLSPPQSEVMEDMHRGLFSKENALSIPAKKDVASQSTATETLMSMSDHVTPQQHSAATVLTSGTESEDELVDLIQTAELVSAEALLQEKTSKSQGQPKPKSKRSHSLKVTSTTEGRRHSGRKKSAPSGLDAQYVSWNNVGKDGAVKKISHVDPVTPMEEIKFESLPNTRKKRQQSNKIKVVEEAAAEASELDDSHAEEDITMHGVRDGSEESKVMTTSHEDTAEDGASDNILPLAHATLINPLQLDVAAEVVDNGVPDQSAIASQEQNLPQSDVASVVDDIEQGDVVEATASSHGVARTRKVSTRSKKRRASVTKTSAIPLEETNTSLEKAEAVPPTKTNASHEKVAAVPPTKTLDVNVIPTLPPPSPKEGSQTKDAILAELKAMRIASLQARNAQLAADIIDKRTKLAEVTRQLKHPAAGTVKKHIKLLHDYNDIRDVGQGLIGMIADNRGVRIGELYEEFGVGLKD